MSDEPTTELAKALKARVRKCHEFDVGGFLGLGGEKIYKVAIRVPTKREQDLAAAGAHDYTAKLGEKAADDPRVLNDALCAFIVATTVREAAMPEKLPAFPSGSFVIETLAVEQIATLVNLVNEVRHRENPGAWQLEESTMEAVIGLCVQASETELPEAALADKPREFLSQLVVLLSLEVAKGRAALALALEATAPTVPAEPPAPAEPVITAAP